MIAFDCGICTGKQATRLNTYKHVWDECTGCGNVFRTRKEAYLAEKVVPRAIWSRISGTDKRVLRTIDKVLLPRLDVIESGEKIYPYYEECVRKGQENTKYADESKLYDDRFARLDLPIEGKSVLDVSGGPGFLVRHMAKRAKRAVMTEYDSNIVGVAARELGIEAVRFDFNTDAIEEVVDGKFDVILVRYAINFCFDPKRFFASLRKIVNPGAWLYIAWVPPSLGVCLRYQFDDYTYAVLYTPETMGRMAAEAGFHLRHRDSDGNYPYRMQATPLHQIMYTPYEIAGRLSSFSPERVVKSLIQVYSLDDAPVPG